MAPPPSSVFVGGAAVSLCVAASLTGYYFGRYFADSSSSSQQQQKHQRRVAFNINSPEKNKPKQQQQQQQSPNNTSNQQERSSQNNNEAQASSLYHRANSGLLHELLEQEQLEQQNSGKHSDDEEIDFEFDDEDNDFPTSPRESVTFLSKQQSPPSREQSSDTTNAVIGSHRGPPPRSPPRNEKNVHQQDSASELVSSSLPIPLPILTSTMAGDDDDDGGGNVHSYPPSPMISRTTNAALLPMEIARERTASYAQRVSSSAESVLHREEDDEISTASPTRAALGEASADSAGMDSNGSTPSTMQLPHASRVSMTSPATPKRSRAVIALQSEADAIPFRRLILTPTTEEATTIAGQVSDTPTSRVPAGARSSVDHTTMLAHDSIDAMRGCFLLKEMLKLRSKYLWLPSKDAEIQNMHTGLNESMERDGGLPREPRMGMSPFWALDDDQTTTMPTLDTAKEYEMLDGVFHVFPASSEERTWDTACHRPPARRAGEFFQDFHNVLHTIQGGAATSFAQRRLLFLEETFRLHRHLNSDKEFLTQKACPHRDFYNVRKVDTHVHHTACMNQKHLLRFIKRKLKEEKAAEQQHKIDEQAAPPRTVITRDGQGLTLRQVFESIGLSSYDLNIDLLDMHAHSQRNQTFHRFDRFNLKYNPIGQSRLREVFLKYDNDVNGTFLAQITNEVYSDLCSNKYSAAEYRVSIYGRSRAEWDRLAAWALDHSLVCENVVYHIQVPRLYSVYHENKLLTCFEDMLRNIFEPLFEVSRDPSSNPKLHRFLQLVVSFDSVDDESKVERRVNKTHNLTPASWRNRHNPSYAYYLWYMYANLYSLNSYRESRGLRTFALRPHCGEAGDIDHLCVGFLLAQSIAHGINLRKNPGIQYLYYLAQIGLHVSPLSNNSLFLDYHRNPFPMFFERGLNVSLSTDDPLQIHLTREPLVEEFAVAAQVWKLSSCDICEIARNSVVQSGFPAHIKRFWLGDARRSPEDDTRWPCWYDTAGSCPRTVSLALRRSGGGGGRTMVDIVRTLRCCLETAYAPCDWGNDIRQTNVPDVRIQFRHDTHERELDELLRSAWRFNDGGTM